MSPAEELCMLREEVRRLQTRVANIASRGTVRSTNDDTKLQQTAAEGHYGEQLEDLTVWQPFGLAARVPPGGDMLILSIGGHRDGAQAIACAHPAYRPTGAGEGETVIYDAGGQTVKLGTSGITITDQYGQTVVMGPSGVAISNGTATIDMTGGDIKITGNMEVQGNVKTVGTLQNNGKDVGSTHTHTDTAGLAAGTTSPPN